MPQFILLCRDKEDGFDLRAATRERHIGYLSAQGGAILLAGPMLNDEQKPIGSMLVVEAEDIAAARGIAKADPYNKAGLFASVDVVPYRASLGDWLRDHAIA